MLGTSMARLKDGLGGGGKIEVKVGGGGLA